MSVLSELEPKNVYRFFEEICAIPHGSFHTKAISDYLVDFAKERGLKWRQDDSDNVVIWKDATEGYENAPEVMIQGHIDMVCEKDPGYPKDMETEGLDLFVEGDCIGARGTTLGGDDGIAVAMALAVLDSDNIPHGPLECLFTANEEVGMIGARALDASDLKAKYMLNVDSEEEKVLTVSCAGAARVLANFKAEREEFNGQRYMLTVGGLVGGHSGEEIHKCRANANILMGRALCELLTVCDIRLMSINGGAKDNAIPREANALVAIDDVASARSAVAALDAALKTEYYTTDGKAFVSLKPADSNLVPMTASCTRRISCFLFCVPNGVQMMSADVPGLVQTSTNLGRMYMEEESDSFVCSFMPRSSVNSQKDEVIERITALGTALGATIEIPSSYSAWEYRPESPLRDIMVEAFKNVYGEEPKIAALHAGLECGIISGHMPWLDCISFGPDLKDIHTPRERMYIHSVERTWRLLRETLKRIR